MSTNVSLLTILECTFIPRIESMLRNIAQALKWSGHNWKVHTNRTLAFLYLNVHVCVLTVPYQNCSISNFFVTIIDQLRTWTVWKYLSEVSVNIVPSQLR